MFTSDMCLITFLLCTLFSVIFFFSSRRRHTRWPRDWSSDVCSSDLSKRGSEIAPARRPQPPPVSQPLPGGRRPARRLGAVRILMTTDAATPARNEDAAGALGETAVMLDGAGDRKSTRLNSSHVPISY